MRHEGGEEREGILLLHFGGSSINGPDCKGKSYKQNIRTLIRVLTF